MEFKTKSGIKTLLLDGQDVDLLYGIKVGIRRDWKNRTETWYAYVQRRVSGKWYSQSLGRFLLGLKRGDKRECEHIDPNNTLDYRRSNIRIATRSQNNSNRRMRKDNTSGFKGVVKYLNGPGWRAQIMKNGKSTVLGVRDTPEEAYELYCAAAKKLHGKFARPERKQDVGM